METRLERPPSTNVAILLAGILGLYNAQFYTSDAATAKLLRMLASAARSVRDMNTSEANFGEHDNFTSLITEIGKFPAALLSRRVRLVRRCRRQCGNEFVDKFDERGL